MDSGSFPERTRLKLQSLGGRGLAWVRQLARRPVIWLLRRLNRELAPVGTRLASEERAKLLQRAQLEVSSIHVRLEKERAAAERRAHEQTLAHVQALEAGNAAGAAERARLVEAIAKNAQHTEALRAATESERERLLKSIEEAARRSEAMSAEIAAERARLLETINENARIGALMAEFAAGRTQLLETIQELNRQSEVERGELQAAASVRTALEAKLSCFRTDLADAKQREADARAALGQAAKDIAALEEQVAAVKAGADAEREQFSARIAASREKVANWRAQVQAAQREKSAAARRLARAQRVAGQREAQLESALRRLERRNAGAVEVLLQRLERLRARAGVRDINAEVAALQTELERLRLRAETAGGQWPANYDAGALIAAVTAGRIFVRPLIAEDLLHLTDELSVALVGDVADRDALLEATPQAAGAILIDASAANDAYDIVLSTVLPENMSDPFEHLALLRRVCAPGGRIVLVGPLWRDSDDHYADPWRAPPLAALVALPEFEWKETYLAAPGARILLEIIDSRLDWRIRPASNGAASVLAPPFMHTIAVGIRREETPSPELESAS